MSGFDLHLFFAQVILYMTFNSEVFMKAVTPEQLRNLSNVDFSGKGGKEINGLIFTSSVF